MGTHCSCGAAIVARTIRPGTIMSRALGVPGLVIEETCAVGHVANFTATSLTMTELAAARYTDSIPKEG